MTSSLAAKSFVILPTKGVSPPQMAGPSINVYGDDLYVFGGDLGQDFNNELYKYNFTFNTWTRIPVAGCIPAARSSHEACIYGDELFIYGGGGDFELVFGTISAFSFETYTWRRVVPAPAQKIPKARRNHASVLRGSKMYIFGGTDGHNRMQDTWFYDFETNLWTEIKETGGQPPAREMHSLVVYRNSMYLFGGLGDEILGDMWQFNFESNQWSEVLTIKPATPRYRHSAVVNGPSMFIFGGQDSMNRLNDIQMYCFSLHSWMPEKQVTTISARTQHRCVMYQGDMYCFGGHDGMSSLNELGRYSFAASSTVRNTLGQAFIDTSDCQICSETKAFPVHSALITARFPALLPYLSPKSSQPQQPFVPTNPIPLANNVIDALLVYIKTDTLPTEGLETQAIISLLSFAEETKSIKLKLFCADYLSEIDLTSLVNLGEVLVAAKKFGLVQLERKALQKFISLIPYSLSCMIHFPDDVLKYYSVLIGRLIAADSTLDVRDVGVGELFEKDQKKLADFARETRKFGGL
ncbi:putative Actin-fragmin kinase [Blattamonas nauphoetae]|uniref:Actin-fragmin kinase n=1 Tax=Blattamonas nauphoetae TaxID=2049346 RepID=A0ABQ9YM91_9EUKA|nr:putative Actin-fragmin kinase [Blattamonas nauphoetae]